MLRSHFPWKLWVPSAVVVTLLTLLTGFDLISQMRESMEKIANQVTDVVARQMEAVLRAGDLLLSSVENKLEEEHDIVALAADGDAMSAALGDILETSLGVGLHSLLALDETGRVLAFPGNRRARGADLSGIAYVRRALAGSAIVLSKPIQSPFSDNEIAPLVRWVGDDKDGRLFMLQTSIDVDFLKVLQRQLQTSIIENIAVLDRDGDLLVGSWPFKRDSPPSIDVREPIGHFDLVAAAGVDNTDVFAKVRSELLLLSLTYFASMLAITALASAYAYRSRLGEILTQAVEQKDVLHRETKHRVSGALQLISSLVSIQSREADDEKVRRALETIKLRIAAVLAVNGRLSHDSDKGNVELGAYLQSVCADLAASYNADDKGLAFKNGSPDFFCDSDKAVRLGLMVTELVTNAYRHGFLHREPGKVDVMFTLEGTTSFKIIVSDDGAGMDQGKQGGLGLELVSLLAEQLACEIQSMPIEQGTRWEIKGSQASLSSDV